MSKEIVIAAYDKDLSWMSGFNSDVKKTIYRKGDILPLNFDEIKVETNVGRCVHTFFNHITKNYYNLSDFTFFAQDFPFDHWEDIIEVVNGDYDIFKSKAKLNIGGYFGYHFNSIGTMWYLPPSKQFGNGNVLSCFSNGHPQDSNPNINVDLYWDMLFDEPKPHMYEFMPGGHFGITKEHAQLRSLNFYKTITNMLEDNVNSPWIIERLECYIFNPKFKTKY
jgi:hypothetical protein